MAKKINLLPVLLLAGGAVALFAFTNRDKKKKKGIIEVEPTSPISETEFQEAQGDQLQENELTNPIAVAAGGAASRITQVAEEATGTIEAVEAAVEKSKAALQQPLSVIKKIKERRAARKAAKAESALQKQKEAKVYEAALLISQNPMLPPYVREAAAAQVAAYERKYPKLKKAREQRAAQRKAKRQSAADQRKANRKSSKAARQAKRSAKRRLNGNLFGDGVPEII